MQEQVAGRATGRRNQGRSQAARWLPIERRARASFAFRAELAGSVDQGSC